MNALSGFLLQNWLWVGLEVLVFFGIGLLMARFVWGRQKRRLARAIDECMSLSTQWRTLGGSQYDLFKKLSSRWQDDRESWENQLRSHSLQLSEKDEAIRRLQEGGAVDVRAVEDESNALRSRIADLERQVEEKEADLMARPDPSSLPNESELEELRTRVVELENERDEAAAALESARNSMVERETSDAATEAEGEREAEVARKLAQLEALLVQRERELAAERTANPQAPVVTAITTEGHGEEEGQPEWERRLAQQEEEFEDELDRHAKTVRGLYHRIAELEEELLSAGPESPGISGGDADAVKALELALEEARRDTGDRDQSIAAMEEELASARVEIERLQSEIEEHETQEREAERVRREADEQAGVLEERDRDLSEVRDTLSQRETELDQVRSEQEELQGRIEDLERRQGKADRTRTRLEAELADALNEMADVRAGFNAKREELFRFHCTPEEHLEMRGLVISLRNSLADARDEIEGAKRQSVETENDRNRIRDEAEELQALVDERSAEVEEAVAEIESQREMIRNLRVKVAQQSGELEGIAEESRKTQSELEEKRHLVEHLGARVTEVESALRDRYEENNRLSLDMAMRQSERDRAAEHARTVEHELDELRWEHRVVQRRIGELEEEVQTHEAARNEAETLLAEAREGLRLVEDRQNLTSEEIGEKNAALELASSELEAARTELEEVQGKIVEETATVARQEAELASAAETMQERETALSEVRQDLEGKEGEIDELRREIADKVDTLEHRDREIAESRERIERLQEFEARVSELEVERASWENDRASMMDSYQRVEADRDQKARQLGDFSDRISRLVHGDGGNDGGGGSGNSLSPTESGPWTEPTDPQIQSLGRAIGELEARAIHAEKNYGVCEQQLGSAREEIVTMQSHHLVELESREKEIRLLRERLESSQQEMEDLREYVRTVSESLQESEHDVKRVEILESHLATLRSDIAARDTAIRELEDQLAYERESRDLRREHTLDLLAVSEVNRVEAPRHVEAAESAPEASDFRLFFDQGSANLNRACVEQIDAFAREYRTAGSRRVIAIDAFAGAEGSPEFNESLSARRADAVRERLLEHGVAQGRVLIRELGHGDQAGAGKDPWKARRVEVALLPEPHAEVVN